MSDVVEDLNEMHKQVYPDGVSDLIPNIAKLQRLVPFEKGELLGDVYKPAVRLAYPGGFTHALGDGSAGAFSLNDAKAGTQKKAAVNAFQIVLRDQMSYEDAGKANGGKSSYIKGTSFFYEGMQKSMRKRLETMLVHGANSIGKVLTYTSGDPSIVIALANWAPGIWSGLEGTEIDIQTAATSSVRGSVTIVAVDIENRKLTLSGTVSGCAANDLIYFKGNFAKEMYGLLYSASNTGTLFGLSAATYSLWKTASLTLSSAALSFAAVKKAAGRAVSKGLDEDVYFFCNPGGWDDIAQDISALRTTDKSEVKKVEIGAEEIVFHGQNGKIFIVPHSMMMEGFGVGLCIPYVKRIGAVDVMMGAPGFDGSPWFHLASKAGVEARNYTNQAIFSESPARNFYISGIVNTT